MSEKNSTFQVGDKVIHWVYGLGEIINLDKKVLDGHADMYYVVQIRDLTLWVLMNGAADNSLRYPTSPNEFPEIFRLLASPGESLSTNSFIRKNQLMEILQNRTLESICQVIRDLTYYKQNNKINENDNSTMERARNFLLDEWSTALCISTQQAEHELKGLLKSSMV